MDSNLVSLTKLPADFPLTEKAVRQHIYNEHHNGLAKSGAVLRIGAGARNKRILLDLPKFYDWLRAVGSGDVKLGKRDA